ARQGRGGPRGGAGRARRPGDGGRPRETGERRREDAEHRRAAGVGGGRGGGRRRKRPGSGGEALMGEVRSLPVPDGLEGERVDAALARLFGLSRGGAAEIIAAGDVLLDGAPVATKSERLHAGAWLEVKLPPPPVPPAPVAERVPGMGILYEDEDIVVVDKPTGVAAHPTTGWTGPTVLGGLLGAGHTIATSGASERQGIVHR